MLSGVNQDNRASRHILCNINDKTCSLSRPKKEKALTAKILDNL